MTLLEGMADLQAPPIVSDQPPLAGKQNGELVRLKKRLDNYANRSQEMKMSSLSTVKHQYELSQEKAKNCHEKWQQSKAKKSTKRTRDPSAPANQLKRKIGNSKTEGPASKHANLDIRQGDEVAESDLKEILGDLDLPTNFTDNNLNDIMTMLEESENSNSSQTGNDEQPMKTKSQSKPHQPTQSLPSQHNMYPQVPPVANQVRHVNTTPSPQLHQTQQHHHPPQPQYASSRAMPGYIKEETMNPAVSQYNRSMSESAAMSLHHIAAPQRISVPMDYPQGAYPTTHPAYAAQSKTAAGHAHSMPPEYARQTSAPVTALGGFYQQTAGQASRNPAAYPGHPAVTGVQTFPQYPTSTPAQLQHQHSVQEMQMRAMQNQAAAASHPNLARANSQPSPGHAYMEQRMAAAQYYSNSADMNPAVQRHAAYAGQQQPLSTHPQYMQSRPHYQHQTSQQQALAAQQNHLIHQQQQQQQQQQHQQQHMHSCPKMPQNPHSQISQDGRHAIPANSMHRMPIQPGHPSHPQVKGQTYMPHAAAIPNHMPIQGTSSPPGSMIPHTHAQQQLQQCHLSSNNNNHAATAAMQQQHMQQQQHRAAHANAICQNGMPMHPSQNPHAALNHQNQAQLYSKQHSMPVGIPPQNSKSLSQTRGQPFIGSSADDLSDLEAILSGSH